MLDVSRLCPRGTIRDILEAIKSIDFLYNEFRIRPCRALQFFSCMY